MIDMNLSHALIEDCNCWHRRFFRCWIDGSYNGQGHYDRNCEYLRENQDNPTRLRSFVISEFCDFMAYEHKCSTSTVQRHMVKQFTGGELDQLNAELIDDALDLIAD